MSGSQGKNPNFRGRGASVNRYRRGYAILFIILAILITSTGGCRAPSAPSNSPAPEPTNIPTPTAPPPTPTPEATSSPTLPLLPITSLVWWTPEDHAPEPLSDALGAQMLEQQIQAFSQQPDGLKIHVILKKPFGKGGILDFLRTASAAAPSVLPDLVTIHSDELAIAARAGLLYPLDELIPTEIQDDLFPFALQAGQVDGQLFGVQWDADVEHLAYDGRAVATPPKTWEELLTSELTYAIPGAMVEGRVNDHFLIQYLGANGHFDLAAEPPIEETALRRVLDFLASARQSGRIPEFVLSLPDADACWDALVEGKVHMAQVNASRFLSERTEFDWVRFATTPTWDGRTITVSHGWMLAIAARDPERRTRAAQVIAWLLRPEHVGPWTRASHRLPTRRAALAHWGDDDPYVPFIRRQLETAIPRPHDESFAAISRALQWAERQVISGNATPDQAVSEVLAEVTR